MRCCGNSGFLGLALSRKISVAAADFEVTTIQVLFTVMDLGEMTWGESIDREEKRAKNRPSVLQYLEAEQRRRSQQMRQRKSGQGGERENRDMVSGTSREKESLKRKWPTGLKATR